MIFQIFNKDILEVLTVFSISPGSRFLRKELKEMTKLNNVNMDNALNILSGSKIIKKENRFLFLNLESAKPIINLVSEQYKELRELPLGVYFSIVTLIFYLSKLRGIDAYLFGSYAKLVFKETSDIDMAIVSDKVIAADKKEINVLIQKINSRYGKKIEIHYFGKNFYKNKNDSLVKEILKNGIKLVW